MSSIQFSRWSVPPAAGHDGVGGVPRQLDLNLFGLFEWLSINADVDPMPAAAVQGISQVGSGALLQRHQHGSAEVVGLVLHHLPGSAPEPCGQGGSRQAPVEVGQIDGPVPSGRPLAHGARDPGLKWQGETCQRRRFQKLTAIGPPTPPPGASMVIDHDCPPYRLRPEKLQIGQIILF